MVDIVQAVNSCDIAAFKGVGSQTTKSDKRSLLLVQQFVRRKSSSYIYLEIGSHLGGTILPHFRDPLCALIYSIDKRPLSQPDERFRVYEYEGNSTQRMLDNIAKAEGGKSLDRIVTYDACTSSLDKADIVSEPDLCFIDGEHTNRAAYRDFKFCLSTCGNDALIVFHDANLIFDAIKKSNVFLKKKNILFSGQLLPDSIYVIALNNSANVFSSFIEGQVMNESDKFSEFKRDLDSVRSLQPLMMKCKNFLKTYFK